MQNVSIFSFSVGFSENQWLLESVWSPRDTVMSTIFWKTQEKVVISYDRLASSLYYYANFYRRYTIMLSFTGYIRAYCPSSKRIDFPFFCGFFLKPMASGLLILLDAKHLPVMSGETTKGKLNNLKNFGLLKTAFILCLIDRTD